MLPHYEIVHSSGRVMATTMHNDTARDVARGLSTLGVYRDVLFTVWHYDGIHGERVFRAMNGTGSTVYPTDPQ